MAELEGLVEGLSDHDPSEGYACFLRLREESLRSDAVYPYFDRFIGMMDSGNSYIRARGLLLIAVNARWDGEHKLDEIIDRYLTHIMDEKPTVARQFIGALLEVAEHKPELAGDIRRALVRANPGRYRDSMAPLIQRDIAEALGRIAE